MSSQPCDSSTKSKSHLALKSTLFTQLNQVQVNLLKLPTKQMAKLYFEQLNEFYHLIEDEKDQVSESERAAQQVNEFLLYPLLTALKKAQLNNEHISEWSDLNEYLLKAINLVLTRAKLDLTQKNLFFDYLNLCCILLSKKQQPTPSPRAISDELLIECFRSLSILFHEPSWSKAYNAFYSFEHMTTIGLLVSVLLDSLIQSNSLSVRLEVLQAFKSLTFYDSIEHDDWSLKLTSDFQKRIGILFASFLPGFSIKLVQGFLLNENLKLMNHKLICHSLQLFAHVLANVFNDSLLDSAYFGTHFEQCAFNSSPNEKQQRDLSQMVVNRLEVGSNWLSTTTQKLFILIDRLLEALMKLDNSHANLALVNFCATLVQCCYVSLNRYMSNLLKVLVTYAANSAEHSSIQQASVKSLRILVEKSSKSIESNSDAIKTNELTTRFSLINVCVEELLVRLPSLVHRSRHTTQLDDAQRQTQLKVLFGYLKFIGDFESTSDIETMSLKEFFHSNANNLHQLLETLLNCVQFDLTTLENFYNVQLNDEAVTSECISKLSNYSDDLKFYLSDKTVYDQLSCLCEYLGLSNAARLLIDQLITSDAHWTQRKLESMFILNLFMRGLSRRANKCDYAELEAIVNLVLTTFITQHKEESEQDGKMDIDDELEELTIGENESSKAESSTMRKNRQIIQTCLIIESISIASRCLKACDFQTYLIETLYFTLENYLHSNVLIRSVSTRCLNDLATSLKYTSIQHLLSSNYDYIMNDLIIKSTRNYQRFQAMRSQPMSNTESEQYSHVYVLCSLLQICDVDLIPYLERLIDDYLNALEIRHAPNETIAYQLVLGICKIIGYMSQSMRARWHPIKFNFLDNENQTGRNSHENEFLHLNLRKVVQAKQKKEAVSGFSDTINEIEASLIRFRQEQDRPNTNDENEESLSAEKGEGFEEADMFKEESDENQKEVALHVKIQCKCLTLCTHLLAHPVKRIRLKVIQLIGELCKNLVEHTNELLPLVHKLWQPICQRFTFDDFIVKQKVVDLLFDLSVLCGDFLGSRVHKEFMPRLCSFMIEQANQSLKHSKANVSSLAAASGKSEMPNETYVYSHAFKLQCSILRNVDKMSVLFELKGVDLEQIIDSVILRYLDKRQPKKLQLLAIEALKNCSLIDSDVVWLCLHYILPFSSIKCEKEQNYGDNFEYSTFIKMKYPNIQVNKDVQNELLKLFISI